MHRCTIAILYVGLLGCGTNPPPERAPADSTSPLSAVKTGGTSEVHQELQGRWQVVSLLKGGQEANDPKGVPIVIEFQKGTQTMTQGGTLLDESTYSLDPAAAPKSIDTIHNAGGGTTSTTPGIYELNGDEARLCMGNAQERPKEFVSTAHYNLVILKRLKAD